MSGETSSRFRVEDGEDQVRLRGPGLGAVFRKFNDCWREGILGSAVAQSLVLPDANRARVAHPVYQEVQLHGAAVGPRLCLLLTGSSFDHHFSAAVTLSADPDDAASPLLEFDVADRCRSAVESLAATYVVGLDSGALVSADRARIVWEVGSAFRGRLELRAGPGSSLAMAEAGRHATRVQIVATIEPAVFTHRLRYGWRWTSADGSSR